MADKNFTIDKNLSNNLNKIFSLLDNCGIKFWLDSGSLLFLIRENEIPINDDVDVSLIYDQLKFEKFYNEIKKSKLKYSLHFFRKKPFKLKIFYDESRLPIDLLIFKQIHGFYMCPQRYHGVFYTKYISKFISLIKRALNLFNINNTTYSSKEEIISKSILFNIGTWVYPKKYFGNIKLYKNTKIPIPEAYAEYLTYRYGDWRIPKKNWIFSEDDGSFSQIPLNFIEDIK